MQKMATAKNWSGIEGGRFSSGLPTHTAGAMFELLERLALGVLLVRRDGTVAWTNQLARTILETTELRLSTIVGDVEARGTRRLMTPHGGMVIATTHQFEGGGDEPLAAIILTEIGAGRVPVRPEVLQMLFGLTPAESRVALAITEGLTPAEAAQNLHVSESTVRTQLKSVFSKLGVRRQPELATLVMSIQHFA